MERARERERRDGRFPTQSVEEGGYDFVLEDNGIVRLIGCCTLCATLPRRESCRIEESGVFGDFRPKHAAL